MVSKRVHCCISTGLTVEVGFGGSMHVLSMHFCAVVCTAVLADCVIVSFSTGLPAIVVPSFTVCMVLLWLSTDPLHC